MNKTTPETIRRELKRLRDFIDTNEDKVATRVAYECELLLLWATRHTVDWPLPLESAIDASKILRAEMVLIIKKALSP